MHLMPVIDGKIFTQLKIKKKSKMKPSQIVVTISIIAS